MQAFTGIPLDFTIASCGVERAGVLYSDVVGGLVLACVLAVLLCLDGLGSMTYAASPEFQIPRRSGFMLSACELAPCSIVCHP